MITKEEAFDIARQKFPGSSDLGFAAIYAEGYYDALVPVEEPEPALPHCSYCDRTNQLTDVRVIIAESEEGWADERRLVCENHIDSMTAGLRRLGFRSHRHGGINYLEDDDCPGCDNKAACPTPEPED